MAEFIWYGTLFGLLVACIHVGQILLTQDKQAEESLTKTLWHALWVGGLWTLFGSYVLAFWLIGLVLYFVSRIAKPKRSSP